MLKVSRVVGLSALLAGVCTFTTWSQGVVINEVMAVNRTAVANAGSYPDWIELHNPSGVAADISGYRLSNDPEAPDRFVFPAGTIIPRLGYLAVWCDDDTTAPGLHSGFALGADGETLTLRRPGATLIVADEVTFGLQIDDYSIGRVNGGWTLTLPSPGKTNSAQATAEVHFLAINEWMAAPTAGEDWFELHNAGTLPANLGGLSLSDTSSTPDLSPIPALSFIAAKGFQRFWADRLPSLGARHANFKLAQGGEYIGLFASAGGRLTEVSFGFQLPGVSEGRLPDGGEIRTFFPESPTPGASNFLPLRNVVINELLAHTDPPFEDAVELHNPTDLPVDISGWYLSDNANELKKYQFPARSVIGARGYLVVYEYQMDPLPDILPGFTFNSAHGETVVFSAATNGELTGHRASETFGPSANAVSFGRVETSVGHEFVAQSERTFGNDWPSSLAEFRGGRGAPNSGPLIGPIVMTEIMFHPPDVGIYDNTDAEFIELHNAGGEEVPLYDPAHPDNRWRLAGGVSFRFPVGSTLSAGEFLLVVGFDPVKDASRRAAFLNTYGLAPNARLLGPWSGKLDNAGEAIELYKPDPPQSPPHPDAGHVPQVLVERIVYADDAPWPTGADGEGGSLQRSRPTAYGNEPVNWIAATPTPLAPPGELRIESVSVADGVLSLTFTANPGRSYELQARPLAASGDWSKVKDVPPVTVLQEVTVTDSLAGAGVMRFYRLVMR